MSVARRSLVTCDRCGWAELFADEPRGIVRAIARQQGWGHVKGDDLCPPCERDRSPATVQAPDSSTVQASQLADPVHEVLPAPGT